jgi:hypothetical protein
MREGVWGRLGDGTGWWQTLISPSYPPRYADNWIVVQNYLFRSPNGSPNGPKSGFPKGPKMDPQMDPKRNRKRIPKKGYSRLATETITQKPELETLKFELDRRTWGRTRTQTRAQTGNSNSNSIVDLEVALELKPVLERETRTRARSSNLRSNSNSNSSAKPSWASVALLLRLIDLSCFAVRNLACG